MAGVVGHGDDVPHVLVEHVRLHHLVESSPAEALFESGGSHEPLDSLSELPRAAWRHEQAVLAIDDVVFGAEYAGDDDRLAERHRLENHDLA